MKRRAWKAVKWLSLGTAVGSTALAIGMVMLHSDNMPPQTTVKKGKQNVEIESPMIVERKGERIVWSLSAEKAKQQNNGTMLMHAPTLTLYTRSQKSIPITGDQAQFDPKKKNVTFNRHVVMHYESWELHCETLIYDGLKDEAYIPGDFTATGQSLQAKGKSMRLKRDSEQIQVDQGIWIKDKGLLGGSIRP